MAEDNAGINLGNVKRLYFAGHHLTRDLIGNVAPLTAVCVAFMSVYAPARSYALEIFDKHLSQSSFWGFALILVTYLICAYFVGAISNIVGNFLHRALQKLPKIGKRSSYSYWYGKDCADIDELYKEFFPSFQYLSQGAAVSPTDKINIMKEYFRRSNPAGYIETYRQFLKVDIVRTTLVYAILLALFCSKRTLWGEASAYVFSMLIASGLLAGMLAVAELPRRIRKVVRAEYQFIIATAQIKQDAERRASAA